MLSSIFLHTADSHLGRVNISSFSEQTLMEMFIEGFDEENKSITFAYCLLLEFKCVLFNYF